MMSGRLAIAIGVAVLVSGCPPPGSRPTRMATGTTPNAVTMITCSDGPRLLVTASAEARLDVLDPDGVAPARSVFLGAGSSPWDVAVWRHAGIDDEPDLPGEARAVVSLSGTHAIALIRPCGAEPDLLHVLGDVEPFSVDPPVTLRDADDVDGDGVDDQVVTQMRPRAPQAVAVAGASIVVTWANTLAFATGADAPMLTGPGLLGRYVVEGDGTDERLRAAGRATLPCENAGGVVVVDDAAVVVSCAGRFAIGATGHEKAGPGGLAHVDLDPMAVTASTTSATTPGPLLSLEAGILSGDLLDGALRLQDRELVTVDEVPGRTDEIDSAFSLTIDADGVAVAGWFDGRVTRDPLGAARTTSATPGPPRGLIDLVHDGQRLWGLHTLSAELVVIPEAP